MIKMTKEELPPIEEEQQQPTKPEQQPTILPLIFVGFVIISIILGTLYATDIKPKKELVPNFDCEVLQQHIMQDESYCVSSNEWQSGESFWCDQQITQKQLVDSYTKKGCFNQ